MFKAARSTFAALLLCLHGPVAADGISTSQDDKLVQTGRSLLARDYPNVMRHMAWQDGFGRSSSPIIARMVAMRWTGWWDDIPSHFSAMRFEEEAREAVRLAGGVSALDKRARSSADQSQTFGTARRLGFLWRAR